MKQKIQQSINFYKDKIEIFCNFVRDAYHSYITIYSIPIIVFLLLSPLFLIFILGIIIIFSIKFLIRVCILILLILLILIFYKTYTGKLTEYNFLSEITNFDYSKTINKLYGKA